MINIFFLFIDRQRKKRDKKIIKIPLVKNGTFLMNIKKLYNSMPTVSHTYIHTYICSDKPEKNIQAKKKSKNQMSKKHKKKFTHTEPR